MQYEISVDAQRTVHERWRVTVDAENEEEAKDIAWEVISEPETDLVVERCLRERVATIDVEVLNAESEGLVQDGVFEDGA